MLDSNLRASLMSISVSCEVAWQCWQRGVPARILSWFQLIFVRFNLFY
jgi:hypothetical protein